MSRIFGRPNVSKKITKAWEGKRKDVLKALNDSNSKEVAAILLSLEDYDGIYEKGKTKEHLP